MPTPVSTARLCLTEEAARILDDAVAVARRRFHAQTTSLHAVSALLSHPSSLLHDACSRARSPAYSSRFQFRALDLCVSVSLDRLPSSKSSSTASDDDPPPVSNSLLAAIKRSQASQRRQPEMYQVTQHSASSIYSISSIKVELKNFVTSILDDPIVSRVLGDAGFRSTAIKLAILQPPAPLPPARYFRGAGGRSPPLFLCNLTDSRSSVGNIPFPFSRSSGDCDGDVNCKRIGEILAKSSGRNPLLVGVCSRNALTKFKKRLVNGKGEDVLPKQIAGVDLLCAEMEIREFVSNGGSKDAFESKVEELSSALEGHLGPGVVVNIGELKVLVEAEDAVKLLVSKLSILLKIYKKKMWLIGAAADYETYKKFLIRFPSLEVDWDIHPLPITSSRSSAAELSTKSRLLNSFVPFGGFFSSPSDYRRPSCITNKPFTRCSTCNEKYKQELSAIKSRVSSVTVADENLSSLPSWLQLANSDMSKTQNVTTEITDEKADSNAKVLWLQRKWDDICQSLHQRPETPRPADLSNPDAPCSMGAQNNTERRITNGSLSPTDELRSNLGSGVSAMLQKTSSQERNVKAPLGFPPESDFHVSNSLPQQSSCNLNLSPDHASSSSISCVTTDLGLGIPASASQELKKSDSHLNRGQLQNFSCSLSTLSRPVNEKTSTRVFPYSSPSGSELCCQTRDGLDQGDYKLIVQKLTEKVAWQVEACHDVGQIISRRAGGNGGRCVSDVRHDTWIGFIGPDKMGKRKMAEVLAEVMFGSKEHLIAVDFGAEERMNESHSVFDSRLPYDIGVRTGRKTMIDYMAWELSRNPCLVILLENVDKIDDPLAQRSLSHAIRTGKFLDSHGREISIVNAIMLITCNSTEEDRDPNHSILNSLVNFSEQTILDALNWQMKIVNEHVEGKTAPSCSYSSSLTLGNKRKQNGTDEPFRHKKPTHFLDLNLPLEEDTDTLSDNSRSWLKDFLEQVDRKVTFKAVNFDPVASKLLHKMSLTLPKSSGSRFRLEVDQEVMSQILAASLYSDGEGPIDDWIKEVLGKACAQAHRIYAPHNQTGLKLVSCPGLAIDKPAPGIRLPRMINLG
ncbi:hypothetical protein V2J09_006937 [Rumex salicifolius]